MCALALSSLGNGLGQQRRLEKGSQGLQRQDGGEAWLSLLTWGEGGGAVVIEAMDLLRIWSSRRAHEDLLVCLCVHTTQHPPILHDPGPRTTREDLAFRSAGLLLLLCPCPAFPRSQSNAFFGYPPQFKSLASRSPSPLPCALLPLLLALPWPPGPCQQVTRCVPDVDLGKAGLCARPNLNGRAWRAACCVLSTAEDQEQEARRGRGLDFGPWFLGLRRPP